MSEVKMNSLSPTEHVVAKVNELGNNKAAEALGVSPAKLCRWLKANGYVRRSQYIRVAAPTTKEVMHSQ